MQKLILLRRFRLTAENLTSDIFVLERCGSIIVTRPRTTVAFIGDTAVLQCKTNDSRPTMYWSRGNTAGNTIASSKRGVYEGYPRLSLNNSTEGQFDLVISLTQSNDAGYYGCAEGFGPAVTAELVLVGKFSVSVCY